jgi:MarR family transcriptional regulator, transcriptional regulator for hemolysin
LFVLARQLRLGFDHGVQSAGVTRAKWTLIVAVARNPGETQRTIAAALEMSEVVTGRLIDRLCASGYLERRQNPSDRRGYRVYLTAAAQPVLDKLGEVAKLQEEEIFKGLSEENVTQLNELLDHISRNVAQARKRYHDSKLLGAERHAGASESHHATAADDVDDGITGVER